MNCRHSKKNEPPLPVLTGLAVHSQTCEKKIIEKFYSNGLCISYDRVIEIENIITKDLCQKYKEAEVVCPPSLYSGLFTCAAIDNIDHNSSSSTSKSSFHGTSISLFQYPTKEMQKKRFIYTESTESLKPSIPEPYTNILPARNTKPEPLNRTGTNPCSNANNLNDIDLWIKQLSSFDFNNSQEKEISFAAFFSANSSYAMQKSISTLLPILEDSINSTAMVRHCIEIVRNTTSHLNPGQITVLTADEPVYALGKQVQWFIMKIIKMLDG